MLWNVLTASLYLEALSAGPFLFPIEVGELVSEDAKSVTGNRGEIRGNKRQFLLSKCYPRSNICPQRQPHISEESILETVSK